MDSGRLRRRDPRPPRARPEAVGCWSSPAAYHRTVCRDTPSRGPGLEITALQF